MVSKRSYTQYLKPRMLSFTILLLIICAGLIVYARTSRGSKNPYSLAEDLPRGALVYAQFRDLPALIKQWDESRLKQQYLSSTNYQQFQHRHLALKLVSRWEEFNTALGFQLDTAAISSSTEAAAAIAIYDIGRLDLVLIAPMSDDKIAATRFFKGKEEFAAAESPDGTTYYRHEVDADRGRQKQALVFATLKGRFILATNEQLLLRAIANLNHQSKKDSLFDDPAFKTLSTALAPHFATVWVDQAKLNEDYYFKHYWLMQNAEQLKGIRAGLFDLEIQEGKWIERREFITAGTAARKGPAISSSQAESLRAMIPADVPFLKLFSVTNEGTLIGALARDTLFDQTADRTAAEGKRRAESWSWRSYDEDDFYPGERDGDEDSYDHYSNLGSSYDTNVDDRHDAKIKKREEPGANPLATELDHQFAVGLQQAIAPAQPLAAGVATSPRTVAGPLCVEFRKVVVLTLQAPGNLRRDALENAISAAAQSHLTIAGPTANMKWVSHDQDGRTWRTLELPMLGWELCYAVHDHALIIANSADLLKGLLAGRIKAAPDGSTKQPVTERQYLSTLDDLTVIRLDQRKQAFDDIMNRLDAESIKERQRASKDGNKDATKDPAGASEEFFSGSIASLLSVTSDVSGIEIRRSSSPNRLHEQLDFILK